MQTLSLWRGLTHSYGVQDRYNPESDQLGSGQAYPRDVQLADHRRRDFNPRSQGLRGGYPNQRDSIRDEPHWRAPSRQPPTYDPRGPNPREDFRRAEGPRSSDPQDIPRPAGAPRHLEGHPRGSLDTEGDRAIAEAMSPGNLSPGMFSPA